MNNEAFRQLVQDRAASSASLRDVARQAVEAEFNGKRRGRRRKRPGGGGGGNRSKGGGREDYDEDDEDEDDADSEGEGRAWKAAKQGPSHDAPDASASSKADPPAYRDRAKERREGKLHRPDDDDDDDLQFQSDGSDDDDLDLEGALARPSRSQPTPARPAYAQSEDEAVQQLSTFQPQSALGHEMLPFLRAIAERNRGPVPLQAARPQRPIDAAPTLAGLAVQNTTLTFATEAHPQDWARSWQRPLEVATVAVNTSASSASFAKASPLNSELLGRIKAALQRRFFAQQQAKREPAAKLTPFGEAAALERSAASAASNSSDGEDIFANAGASDLDEDEEEVGASTESGLQSSAPPKPGVEVPANEVGEDAKSCDGAAASNSRAPKARRFVARPPIGALRTAAGGGGATDPSVAAVDNDSLAAAPIVLQRPRLAGLSAAEGYGDDFDADFTGHYDDDANKRKTKKKRKKKGGADSDSE